MMGIGDFTGAGPQQDCHVYGAWVRKKKSTSAVKRKEVYGQEARGEE